MKIGIITQYYKSCNYGGILQAFALNKKMTDMGNECETINYAGGVQLANRHIRKKYSLGRMIKRAAIKLREYGLCDRHSFEDRVEAFRDFCGNRIPNSVRVYNRDDISDTVEIYDAFVCGSDRIWHTKRTEAFNDDYILGFVKNKPCFSYAASANNNELTKPEIELYKHYLRDFIGVSLREEKLKDEFVKYGIFPTPQHVLDPVFLMTPDQWNNELGNTNTSCEGKYIFVYLLGNNAGFINKINSFASHEGINVVCVPMPGNLLSKKTKKMGWKLCYSAGPVEFLNLIKDAECIFTDSFHCTAFSVMFHKKIVICNRDNPGGNTQFMDRISDLIHTLGIPNSVIMNVDTDNIYEEKIDYNRVDENIEELRRKSQDFLTGCIEKARCFGEQ